MLARLTISLTLALLAVSATSGAAFAAFDPSRDELMIGTGAVLIAFLTLLTIIAAIKHAFGLDKMPPAPEPDAHASGHH